MRSSILAICTILLLSGLCRVSGIKIHVPPGNKECVSLFISEQQLQATGWQGATATAHGEIIAARTEVTILSPSDSVLFHQFFAAEEFTASVDVETSGTYKVCFLTVGQHIPNQLVDLAYFMLTHKDKVVTVPKGTANQRSQAFAHKEHLQEVREGIYRLSEVAEMLSKEQAYMLTRLERHHQTNLSTNRRSMFYSLLEMGALVAVSLMQVLTIRHLFHAQEAASRTKV